MSNPAHDLRMAEVQWSEYLPLLYGAVVGLTALAALSLSSYVIPHVCCLKKVSGREYMYVAQVRVPSYQNALAFHDTNIWSILSVLIFALNVTA